MSFSCSRVLMTFLRDRQLRGFATMEMAKLVLNASGRATYYVAISAAIILRYISSVAEMLVSATYVVRVY